MGSKSIYNQHKKMKLHLPTGLLTLLICATNFASAAYYFDDTKLDALNEGDEINVYGCNVEVNSVNGGITLYAYSQSETDTPGGPVPGVTTDFPVTFKANSNLVLNYAMVQGLSSTNAATIIANEISSDGRLYECQYANFHALEGDINVGGKRYDDGYIGYSSLADTNLIADKGSINIGTYLTMERGTISATNGNVNITDATVTVNGLSAQDVNINGTGVLNIGNGLSLANEGSELSLADACRVEVGEITVGTGAKLGINGATLVFHEGSSITLAAGATLTAFNNVNFEFIVDADSITDDGVAYRFDVFKGMTDEGNLALIEGFEEAVAAGEIGITLKGMTAEGELIDLDAGSADVTFKNGTLSISSSGSVPEPTTATLSLLALAALAARRRRR